MTGRKCTQHVWIVNGSYTSRDIIILPIFQPWVTISSSFKLDQIRSQIACLPPKILKMIRRKIRIQKLNKDKKLYKTRGKIK